MANGCPSLIAIIFKSLFYPFLPYIDFYSSSWKIFVVLVFFENLPQKLQDGRKIIASPYHFDLNIHNLCKLSIH
jgi:hypothetical protein